MDTIPLLPDFRDFLKFLNDEGVEYLVVGGMAVNSLIRFRGQAMFRLLFIWAVALVAGCGGIEVTTQDPPCRVSKSNASNESTTTGPADVGSHFESINEGPASIKHVEIDVARPTSVDPVAAGMAVFPSAAGASDVVTLALRVRIAPGWHIYGMGGSTSPAHPTQISMTLPDGVEAEGQWTAPPPDSQLTSQGMASVYHDDVVFWRVLRISESAAEGAVELVCQLNYQACDRSRCLMPTSVTQTASLEIKSDAWSE